MFDKRSAWLKKPLDVSSIFADSRQQSIELTRQNAGQFYEACEALFNKLRLALPERPKFLLEHSDAFPKATFTRNEGGIEDVEVVITTRFANESSCEELLTIVAHELGHIKHKLKPETLLDKVLSYTRFVNAPYERYQSQKTILSYVAMELARPFVTVREALTAYLHRQEELEADKTAMDLVGAKPFLKVLTNIQNSEQITETNESWVDYVRRRLYDSHPSIKERISYAERIEEGRSKGNSSALNAIQSR